MKKISQQMESAIIGHWRGGTSFEEIAWQMGVYYSQIVIIIYKYEQLLRLSEKEVKFN